MRHRENPLRLQQMWPVDHASIETRDAGRGRRGEGRDHPQRMLALGVGRRKRGVDRGNLVRVNRKLAAESVAARGAELVLQPRRIAKVGTHPVDGLHAQSRRRDGFSGKLAIHPDQIAAINAAFAPTEAEREHARRVVAAFAAAPGAGVASLDGRMIDRPHLVQAQRILAAVAEPEG